MCPKPSLRFEISGSAECPWQPLTPQFAEKGVDYEFDFDVESLADESEFFQATYWHNRLFNPTLPGQVRILGFTPKPDV
jgi:hypothetical protein